MSENNRFNLEEILKKGIIPINRFIKNKKGVVKDLETMKNDYRQNPKVLSTIEHNLEEIKKQIEDYKNLIQVYGVILASIKNRKKIVLSDNNNKLELKIYE
ncbi:MAG: hypothetical protein V1815_01185 [Candidatus Woesearchaeota archaeon]